MSVTAVARLTAAVMLATAASAALAPAEAEFDRAHAAINIYYDPSGSFFYAYFRSGKVFLINNSAIDRKSHANAVGVDQAVAAHRPALR